MERLTERLGNKVINVKYASQHETAIHRLAAIEDILGDDYDLDRLRELVKADRDGRCVVHCNDCRWGQMDDLGIMHCHKYHMHKNVDGFCDEGERKEPENENTYSSI